MNKIKKELLKVTIKSIFSISAIWLAEASKEKSDYSMALVYTIAFIVMLPFVMLIAKSKLTEELKQQQFVKNLRNRFKNKSIKIKNHNNNGGAN